METVEAQNLQFLLENTIDLSYYSQSAQFQIIQQVERLTHSCPASILCLTKENHLVSYFY